jgi:hypothetical protein
MPRKQRLKSKTGYYHIMCRGNERCMPFLDMVEKSKLRLEAALELFRQLLRERGIDYNTYQKAQLTDTLLKEFSHRTNWSVREIAALTGINKDKVNRMIRG